MDVIPPKLERMQNIGKSDDRRWTRDEKARARALRPDYALWAGCLVCAGLVMLGFMLG